MSPAATMATGGATPDPDADLIVDPGYPEFRRFADVDGDDVLDFCRFVGDAPTVFLSCQLGKLAGGYSAEPYGFNSIEGIDQGYRNLDRALVDVNADRRADFCRYVGDAPEIHRSCDLAGAAGFKVAQDTDPIIDLGYPEFRQLGDVDGDGLLDFCRFVGNAPTVSLSCQLGKLAGGYAAEPYGFNSTEGIDQGYPDMDRDLVDVNADRRADFCRYVGDAPDVHRLCDLAGTAGFGPEQKVPDAALAACWSGAEKDGAFCYNLCDQGFHGVGPVCWGACPEGYADDGATCRRDPSIVAKESYGRGVGTVIPCGSKEYDAGLCYTPCSAGFHGVGPVCWASCPEGYADDGGTCRKDAHIFAKPSYGRGAGYLTREDYRGIFSRYIRDHRNIWLPSTSPLRPDEKTYLSQYFPGRIIDSVGVVELDGMTGAFNHTHGATAYGTDLIIIRKGDRNTTLLKHELVHACQYERFGVEGFAIAYADQFVDSGYDYGMMPFELEAKDFVRSNVKIEQHLGYCGGA